MKTKKTETTNKTTYVIHSDLRGAKPKSNKIANSLRILQTDEYFFTEAENRRKVYNFARSLSKSFTVNAVDNNHIRVTCTGMW